MSNSVIYCNCNLCDTYAIYHCRLDWNTNVRVADFGLSRVLVEGKDYYRVQTQMELPLRWMAPESLSQRLFTTQSDVVSKYLFRLLIV